MAPGAIAGAPSPAARALPGAGPPPHRYVRPATDPRQVLAGQHLDRGRKGLRFEQYKMSEYDDFNATGKSELASMGIDTKDKYEKMKTEICSYCDFCDHLLGRCPFLWSATWLGQQRFGKVEADLRVLKHQAHRARQAGENLLWASTEVLAALSQLPSYDDGQPSFDYLSQISRAEGQIELEQVIARIDDFLTMSHVMRSDVCPPCPEPSS